jgi:hypothetical protein
MSEEKRPPTRGESIAVQMCDCIPGWQGIARDIDGAIDSAVAGAVELERRQLMEIFRRLSVDRQDDADEPLKSLESSRASAGKAAAYRNAVAIIEARRREADQGRPNTTT